MTVPDRLAPPPLMATVVVVRPGTAARVTPVRSDVAVELGRSVDALGAGGIMPLGTPPAHPAASSTPAPARASRALMGAGPPRSSPPRHRPSGRPPVRAR